MVTLIQLLREPLAISFIISLCIFLPMVTSPSFHFASLSGSIFESSVYSIENTIIMYCTVSITIPLFIDLALDLFSFKAADVSYLGYRFLSLFSVVIVNCISIAYQHRINGPTVAITMFLWGFYLEFCVISSFLHYLIPEHFSICRVVLLNSIMFIIALVPNLMLRSGSPRDALQVIFFLAFYSYCLLFSAFLFNYFRMLHKEYQNARMPFWRWFSSLDPKDVCVIILTFGLSLTVFIFVIVFHVLIPDMPNIGNVESSVHQLVDISRSSLCIFTYIIPYRMFRERLIEARRDLEIKTEFVKYIQHEIRSPVGSLVVGLELLEAELTSETPVNLTDIIERVSEMRSTTNSVIEILDDLLLYEKLERNTVDMHLALLNPVLGMRKVLKNIGHNVEVQPFDVPLSRNWRINLDRVKMKLAINAILAQGACNAQDKDAKVEILFQLRNASHMPDVKVRRRSSLSLIVPEIDSTAHFSIVIVDRRRTNPDPSAFKYLHEEHLKFERIGHDDGRGSGIGLWIARKFVKLHGGEVKAEVADNGVGMQICIDLPLTVLSDEEVNDDEDNSLFEPSTSLEISTLAKLIKQRIPMISTGVKYLRRSSDSSGVRDSAAIMPLSTLPSNDTIDKPLAFLVVDDSAMVRKMTSQLIKHYGHLASEAVDGEDAVRKVKASAVSGAPFEVILMDNQMPNLMGTEATRIIRHELGFEGLIFGVTGNVLEEDLAKFVTNGANEVIAKPLTQDKFFDKILCHQALEHRIHPVRRASDGRRSSEGKHSGYTDGFIIESHSGYSSESEVAWQQENEEKREFKSLHFLIVDDSSMVRKLSSQLVRSFSHTLAEAIDGLDAIAAVKRSIEENRPYDIILMDNQMPKMMGVEATRIIREDLNYSGLIFGVTGNALDEDIKMFLRNGADDVLLKPLTKDKFNENILRFERIDRRRSSDMKRLTDSLVAKRIASSGRLAETPT